MLKDKASSAIVASGDLARARRFYGEALGLNLVQDTEQVLTYRTGETRLHVYASADAGTNKTNAVVWGAGNDFDAIIAELRSRGVRFEEYPELGMAVADGVHTAGDFNAAWFKDPDGNLLHINSM